MIKEREGGSEKERTETERDREKSETETKKKERETLVNCLLHPIALLKQNGIY